MPNRKAHSEINEELNEASEDELDQLIADSLLAGDQGEGLKWKAHTSDNAALAQQFQAFLSHSSTVDTLFASLGTPLRSGKHLSSFVPGQLFAHFELLELLGQGSFASVWRARDTRLERTVALKFPHLNTVELTGIDHHIVEARTLARLKHSNIVQVHEVNVFEGQPYLVCDLIVGQTLESWLKSNKPNDTQATQWCRSLALALQHAHDRGVVHRDVKPTNILIGEDLQPHLADFGLSQLESRFHDANRKQIMGTLAFMSPEQALGAPAQIDHRSDIYCLGIVYYQLLTGKRPFQRTDRQLFEGFSNEPPLGLRHHNNCISHEMESICLKCLQYAPEERYATARELAEEFDRVLNGVSLHKDPNNALSFIWGWLSKVALAAIVLLVLVVVSWLRRDVLVRPAANLITGHSQRSVEKQLSPKLHIGVVRAIQGLDELTWCIDSNSRKSDSIPEIIFHYGTDKDTAIAGRWAKGKGSLPGIVRVAKRESLEWVLDRDGDCRPDSSIEFGIRGDVVLVGDWNDDQIDDLTVARRAKVMESGVDMARWHWLVNLDDSPQPEVSKVFMAAQDSDIPIVGTWWNDDLALRPGIVRPNHQLGLHQWFLQSGNELESSSPVCFGATNTLPIASDFNADGLTDFAVVETVQGALQWSFDFDRDGSADQQYAFGLPGDQVVLGNWQLPHLLLGVDNGPQVFSTSSPIYVENSPDGDDMRFVVTNSGSKALSISGLEVVSGGFVITQNLTQKILEPGNSDCFNVIYKSGTDDGMLQFQTNAPDFALFRFAIVPPQRDAEPSATNRRNKHRFSGKGILIVASDAQANSRFGHAISASGDYIYVGSPLSNLQGIDCGAVHVYIRQNNGFAETGKLYSRNHQTGDLFGASIASNDRWLVVGAPQSELEADYGPGYVTVFEAQTGTVPHWLEVARLEMPTPVNGSKFGATVAISGDTIVVGAPNAPVTTKAEAASRAGCVFIFERSIESRKDRATRWHQTAQLTSPNPRAEERFGWSVDIDRFAIAAGARGTTDRRSAFVFLLQSSGRGSWGGTTSLMSTFPMLGESFGRQVRIQRPFVIVGPAEVSSVGAARRAISVFFEHPLQNGRRYSEVKLSDRTISVDPKGGIRLAMASDRELLAIGMSESRAGTESPAVVQLYQGDAEQAHKSTGWVLLKEFKGPANSSPEFGYAVALNPGYLLIGDPALTFSKSNQGAVFAFPTR